MHHDIAIIGSGPSCYAYLLGLPKRPRRGAIFTSDKLPYSGSDALHPKLFGEGEKIIDPLPGLPFGPTCSFGGLSRAWGGILAIPRPDEVRKLFEPAPGASCVLECFRQVLAALRNDFRLFVLRQAGFQRVLEADDINVDEERTYLITGSNKYAWENSGISLADPIRQLAASKGFGIRMGEISRITFDRHRNEWSLFDSNCCVATCKKVVLAAGGIGSLKLLSGVCERRGIATFDHVPLQLYCLQLGRSHHLEDFSGAATPLRTVLRGDDFIAAAYCIDSLSAAFLKKQRLTRIASTALPPAMLARMFFVQIWHESLTFKLGLGGPKRDRRPVSWSSLAPHAGKLFGLGLVPFFAGLTAPGEGFHYMSLTDANGSASRDILDDLKDKFGQSFELLGGAGLVSTILENPTLTFMADAYAKASVQQ